MSRSLVIGLAVTIVIIVGLAFFFYTSFIKEQNKSALEAVPQSAAVILEVNNVPLTWSAVSNTDIWKDLKQNEAFQKLDHLFTVADSAIHTNTDMLAFLSDNHTTISFHSNRGEHLSILFVSETGSLKNGEESARWVASLVNGSVSKRVFDKEVLFEITDEQKLPFLTLAVRDKLLMLSEDGSLVEDAIQQLKYPSNKLNVVEQAQKLELEGAQIGMYVQYEQLSSLVALGSKSEYKNIDRHLRVFANWSVLTVSMDAEHLNINGSTYTDDSLFQFLDLFKSQAPLDNDLSDLIPMNTAFFSQLNISDYGKFNTDLTEYLQNTGALDEYSAYVDSIENLYQVSITEKLTPQIGPLALIGLHESAGADYQSQVFSLMQFKNAAAVETIFDSYEQAIERKGQSLDSGSITYKNYTIKHLQLGNLFKRFFGHNFEQLISPYYVVKNNTFIFANQSSTLMFMLDELDQKQTLGASESYRKQRERRVSASSVTFFISPGKNISYASIFANDEFLSVVNRYVYDIKKFEFAEIQYANSNNGTFFTNVSIRFNPAYKEETKLLWATKLDTTFDMQPAIVYNSALQQNCILVQDVINNLYYINNTGTILWKTKLSGKINSKIYQVDPTRTGEIAYLFSTNKQACLITPSGKNIYGFPVHFPGTATAGITLTDFYKDSTFQFFVPLVSSKIMGYELNGKPIQGWNPRNIESVIETPLSYFVLAGGPFMMGTSANQQLLILPFGSKQPVAKAGITVSSVYPAFAFQSDTTGVDIWVTDTTGQVVWYRLDNQMILTVQNQIVSTNEDPVHQVIQTSAGYAVLAGHFSGFTLFDEKGTKLISKVYMDSLHTDPFFTYTREQSPMIGYADKNQSVIHWVDLKGNEYKMPSVAGITPFITGDVSLNNTNFLVCGDKANNVLLYRVK
jgi:hypothetical protein